MTWAASAGLAAAFGGTCGAACPGAWGRLHAAVLAAGALRKATSSLLARRRARRGASGGGSAAAAPDALDSPTFAPPGSSRPRAGEGDLADLLEALRRALVEDDSPAARVLNAFLSAKAAAAALRVFFPLASRKLRVAQRLAPVYTRYFVEKRRLRRIRDPAKRAAAWERVHEWGAVRVADVVTDFGGFYTKVSQIFGSATQMVPPAYIRRLLVAEHAFGAPPVPFELVRGIVERAHGRPLEDVFSEFSYVPEATGSVAQVHFAVVRETGEEVAVKVVKGEWNRRYLMSDIGTMLDGARFLKFLGLDGGIDLPTIIQSYQQIVPAEFDLSKEASTMRRFQVLFQRWGLSERLALPEVVDGLSNESVLVAERVRGTRMVDVLKDAKEKNTLAALPPEAEDFHGGWDEVFRLIFEAWGRMVFLEGAFHTDPHPGNLMFDEGGRLVILDWGQTKTLPRDKRVALARVVQAMAAEDLPEVAARVEQTGEFQLQRPSPAIWILIAYTYLDTRPTPLAGINIFDLSNNPIVQNPFVHNSLEAFPLIRTSFIIRGLMDSCDISSSMVLEWRPFAEALVEGRPDQVRRESIAGNLLRTAAVVKNRVSGALYGAQLALSEDGGAGGGGGSSLMRTFNEAMQAQQDGEATRELRRLVHDNLTRHG